MAMSQGYLEHFIKDLQPLPHDLERYMMLIKELDTIVQEKGDELDADYVEVYNTLKELSPEERRAKIGEVTAAYDEVLEICGDKVQLAQQAYDAVDKYIRKLDTDAKRLEIELIRPDAQPSEHLSTIKKKKKRGPGRPSLLEENNAMPMPVAKLDMEMEMPVDPNEPTYCTCHCVSYGEMIACENIDCPIEWYHFGCVGLLMKPKGKWVCPSCRDVKKT